MSDGISGDQAERKGVDFVCEGDINTGCLKPCYLGCEAASTFTVEDMVCIFGYESVWVRIKKEATDKATS
jgi:hypothetical protein